MKTGDNMKEHPSRLELRERIVDTALQSFVTHGIKSITMDDIAAALGISKRTLYEVFADKETLLMECLRRAQDEGDTYVKEVYEKASNVLEVLLKLYQRSIEKFHNTNKKFFEDIKKYPKVYVLLHRNAGCCGTARTVKSIYYPGQQTTEEMVFQTDRLDARQSAR